jgi:hypothetical protein
MLDSEKSRRTGAAHDPTYSISSAAAFDGIGVFRSDLFTVYPDTRTNVMGTLRESMETEGCDD